MTASRLIKVLFLSCSVLLGIVVVTAILRWPRQKAPFQHLTTAAQQVTLRSGASHIRLSREGTAWSVSVDSGTPAYATDKNKVASLLESLEALSIEDEISDRADRVADFELDDQRGLDVSLFGKNGARQAEGIFGKQAPDFAHIYFRFPGKSPVYLARGVILGELGGTSLSGWRSHELLTLPENEIQAIFIEGPGFKTPLVRSSDTWSANGVLLDPGKVFALVGALSHLRAEDFVDPAQNPDLTAAQLIYATLTIQTSSGNHIVHLGRMDKTRKRYPASVDSSPDVGWLTQAAAEALLKKVSDFKQP